MFLHQPRQGKEFKICSTVLHRCWLDKASINFLQLLLWVLILLIRGVDVVLDASNTQCWLRCYGQARVFWISQMITYGLTWEKRRHFVTPPVVFPRNNVCGMSAEFHTDEASLPISLAARPIRSTTQIWIVTRHQYGISPLVSQTLFHGETTSGVAKCRLFSQATYGQDNALIF